MIAALRRLGGMAITLAISSFVIFGSVYAAPGDPVTFLIGNPESLTPERLAAVRAQYHLDEPFFTQYLLWAKGVLQGDFGMSFVYQQPVGDILGSRLPVTLALVAFAAVIFITVGVLLGVVSALKRGGILDTIITGVTTFATSIPAFVVALVLVSVFAVSLGWFEVTGDGEGFVDRVYHLTLPAISLALGSIAVVSRVTRQTMLEQQSLEHVDVARSFGLRSSTIVRRHVLRNAVGPVMTMCGLTLAGMLAGTVVIESVFGLNGMGSLLVESINAHDFPVVQATMLYMIVAYMVVTTIIDLLYPLADARTLTRGGTS
jgi:peptide/nickel transport system permease protein